MRAREDGGTRGRRAGETAVRGRGRQTGGRRETAPLVECWAQQYWASFEGFRRRIDRGRVSEGHAPSVASAACLPRRSRRAGAGGRAAPRGVAVRTPSHRPIDCRRPSAASLQHPRRLQPRRRSSGTALEPAGGRDGAGQRPPRRGSTLPRRSPFRSPLLPCSQLIGTVLPTISPRPVHDASHATQPCPLYTHSQP